MHKASLKKRYLPMTVSFIKKVTVQVREGDIPVAEKDTSGDPYPGAPKCKPRNQLPLFESYPHLKTF